MGTLRSRVLLALAVTAILGACLATLGAQRAGAGNGKRSDAFDPAIKLACLTKGTHRYVGKVEPSGRCEIGGLVEASLDLLHGSPEPLGRGGTFARFPIEGEIHNGTAWTGWGESRSLGLGQDIRSGHNMNLTTYRRVRCADGSSWYSRADVSDAETARAFYLRLPVCGDSIPRGDLGTR